MSTGQPFGSPMSPAEAVAKAAAALAPTFQPSAPPSSGPVRLTSGDPSLPDAELSMVRDRRLFSRTWPLVVEARATGSGPAGPIVLRLHRRRLRGQPRLRGDSPDTDPWPRRFVGAGLLAGATTMTGIQDLRLEWTPERRTWRLRLQTLAGGLIGTAPGSSIAVPMEPDDVRGLMQILRALRKGATPP